MRYAAWLLALGCSAPPAEAPRPAASEVVDAPAPELRSAHPESERWHEVALGWFNKGDFDKAKEAARRAVQVDPGNLAARKLLNDIHGIVGGGPAPSFPEHDVRIRQVAVEQAQVEITKHLIDGRRYLGARMYASALKEFEAAELKIRAQPYDVAALNALLPEIRAGISASRR